MFNTLMQMADAAKIDASPEDIEYLSGYLRGLRRAHHGDNFGTESDHQKWLDCGAVYPERAAGYVDGLGMKKPRMFNK